MSQKLCAHNSEPNVLKNNKYITSDNDKAIEFLNTFHKASTVDDGLLRDIPGLSYCQPTDIQPDFSPASVQKHLKSINSQSTTCPDGFPSILYIMFFNYHFLLYVINLSQQDVCHLFGSSQLLVQSSKKEILP